MSRSLAKQQKPSSARTLSPYRNYLPGTWMTDMFDQFLAETGDNRMAEMINTAMDVSETEQAFEVKMDLPGINPDDVDIQIDNNTLTVRGKRVEESTQEERHYHRVERYSGSFSRSIVLPASINEDETAAEYRDGVLKVVIPKTEDAKPRKITIGK